jgi:streptomycin 6-kinase
MTIVSIPDSFARTVADVHGEDGRRWLAQLPALLAECERRWSLTLDSPFALSYNYVAPATRADGTKVVLKAGVPGRELRTEIESLRLFDGRGSVALFDSDVELGAMVLERLQPGDTLDTVTDDVAATAAAAQVMRDLWRPPPAQHTFPTVADWGLGFERLRRQFGDAPPFSPRLVDEAEELFASLSATSAAPMLLHGDLHHGNILSARRRPWLAIDPKGLVGEPAYEVGALLRNPRPALLAEPQPGAILARRIDQLSDELGFDRARVRGWALAQAVLSAWWSYEDHGRGWEFAITCAELLGARPG